MDERACVALSKKTVSSLFRTTFYALKVIVLNKDASQDGGVLAKYALLLLPKRLVCMISLLCHHTHAIPVAVWAAALFVASH